MPLMTWLVARTYRGSFPIPILSAAGAGSITGGFLSRGVCQVLQRKRAWLVYAFCTVVFS